MTAVATDMFSLSLPYLAAVRLIVVVILVKLVIGAASRHLDQVVLDQSLHQDA